MKLVRAYRTSDLYQPVDIATQVFSERTGGQTHRRSSASRTITSESDMESRES